MRASVWMRNIAQDNWTSNPNFTRSRLGAAIKVIPTAQFSYGLTTKSFL